MKRSSFSEEQIACALRLAESGTPVVDVCRHVRGLNRQSRNAKIELFSLALQSAKKRKQPVPITARQVPFRAQQAPGATNSGLLLLGRHHQHHTAMLP